MLEHDCFFCRKLAKLNEQKPPDFVWQFENSVAFLGAWQSYCGYSVLVSRRHATELHGLPSAVRTAFLEELCVLAKAIHDTYQPHKLNYELLGNQVPHLHWHIFPRYENDPDRLKPVWSAIERAETDSALRARLEMGPEDRHVTIARLQKTLMRLTSGK